LQVYGALALALGFRTFWTSSPCTCAAMSSFSRVEASAALQSVLRTSRSAAPSWNLSRASSASLRVQHSQSVAAFLEDQFYQRRPYSAGDSASKLCICCRMMHTAASTPHRRKPDATAAGAQLLVQATVVVIRNHDAAVARETRVLLRYSTVLCTSYLLAASPCGSGGEALPAVCQRRFQRLLELRERPGAQRRELRLVQRPHRLLQRRQQPGAFVTAHARLEVSCLLVVTCTCVPQHTIFCCTSIRCRTSLQRGQPARPCNSRDDAWC